MNIFKLQLTKFVRNVKYTLHAWRIFSFIYDYTSRYSRLLAHYPYVVVGVVSVFVAVCLLVTIIMGIMPDFSDPTLVSTLKMSLLLEVIKLILPLKQV